MKQFATPLVLKVLQMKTTTKRQCLLSTMANWNPNQPNKQNDHKSSNKNNEKFHILLVRVPNV